MYNENVFLKAALGDEFSSEISPLPSLETSVRCNSPYMTVKKYRTLTQQARQVYISITANLGMSQQLYQILVKMRV